ncbi:hypothetical protein LTR17_002730 [Elasticomyces elasticus]|nr:hypothetical protein LTR17_002730 [Elasticomyces elasticus]
MCPRAKSKAAAESTTADLDMHNRCIVRRIEGVTNKRTHDTVALILEEIKRLSRAECDIYYTLDKALSGVVAATWIKLCDSQSSVRLTSREMLDDLENIYDVLQRRKANNDGVFEESIFNLRGCESRRSIYTRIMVVVGHVFPAELVELIWEDACSEGIMGHLRGWIVKNQAEEWTTK